MNTSSEAPRGEPAGSEQCTCSVADGMKFIPNDCPTHGGADQVDGKSRRYLDDHEELFARTEALAQLVEAMSGRLVALEQRVVLIERPWRRDLYDR